MHDLLREHGLSGVDLGARLRKRSVATQVELVPEPKKRRRPAPDPEGTPPPFESVLPTTGVEISPLVFHNFDAQTGMCSMVLDGDSDAEDECMGVKDQSGDCAEQAHVEVVGGLPEAWADVWCMTVST